MIRSRFASKPPGDLLRPKMPELDSIRGIAIAMVLLFHGFALNFDPNSFPGIWRQAVWCTGLGRTGVQLFFVLSGFLITGILLDSKPKPHYYSRFYFRRALRILPAYLAVLVLLAILSQTSWLGSHKVSGKFLLASLLYCSNISPLFGIAVEYPVLWSLAVEEHFYLLWPCVVSKTSSFCLGVCAASICLLSPLVRAVSFVHSGFAGPYFYTWCNSDALCFGALIALLLRRPACSRNLVLRIAALASAVGVSILYFGAKHGIASGLTTIGFALRISAFNLFFASAILLALLVGSSRWSFLVCRPVLLLLGRISYGLYLVHLICFYLYDKIVSQFAPALVATSGHITLVGLRFCIATAFAILVAYISREYFEQRFLALKDSLDNAVASIPRSTLQTAERGMDYALGD